MNYLWVIPIRFSWVSKSNYVMISIEGGFSCVLFFVIQSKKF